MRTYETLAADVIAENKANDIANQIAPKLLDFFRPLVGCKILKADGSLLKKIQEDMPKFNFADTSISVYRMSSDYSLAWQVKVCEHVKNAQHCTYRTVTVYIGDLKGAGLEKVHNDRHPLKADYNLQDIVEGIKKYRAAQKVAEAAQSALFPFTEYKEYLV